MARSLLNRRSYENASKIVLALVGFAALYVGLEGRWFDGAALAALVLLGASFIAAHDRLPSLFTILFVSAGLINAIGYIFDLWKTPVWFDEAVHAYTSFTICAAIGWFLLGGSRLNAAGHEARFTAAIAGLGLLLGILWEIFEWIIGIIGNRTDTIRDLLMDTIGAVAAGLFCAWIANRARKESNRYV